MASEARTATDRPAVPPFVFEYSSVGGPELGQGIHERESHLRLNSADQSAFLEKHRSDSDAPGEAIGTFRARLPADAFARVRNLVTTTQLAQLKAPNRGGPGSSLITLRYEEGDTKIEKSFTSFDTGLIAQVQGLISEIVQILVVLNRSPERALQITVAQSPSAPSFSFVATNIGTTEVCLTDPRSLPTGNIDVYAGIRWAEYPTERPGVTAPPLQWTFLGLARPEHVANSESPIVLKPGDAFTIPTEPWKNPSPGRRFLVQGRFSDYGGPTEVRDCYRIRGAVFSKIVEVTK